ncbi:hypothetical protein WJX79_003057 [Trebouxia sp. C0005]
MIGATLTTPQRVAHALQCNLSCRRERNQKLVASSSRPFVRARTPSRSASKVARAAESATFEQESDSEAQTRDQTDEARRRSADNAELNQLARMMPDPAEDELFDSDRSEDYGREDDKQLFEQQGLSSDLLLQGDTYYNSSYVDQYDSMGVGDYGYPDDLEEEMPDLDPKEVALGLAQAEFNYSARKRWEIEQAEARALELHHEQGTRGINRYEQSHALAQILEHIEQTDALAGLESPATPSWIRAHFWLEEMWDEFAQGVLQAEKKQAESKADEIENAAMLMLEDDEEFWQDEYDEGAKAPSTTAGQNAAVTQKPPPGRETRGPGREARGPNVDLDRFMLGMPGVEPMLPETEMLDQMLGSADAALDDTVDEDASSYDS